MENDFSRYFSLGLIPGMAFPKVNDKNYDELRIMLMSVVQDPRFDAFEIGYAETVESLNLIRDLLCESHMHFCYAAQSALMKNGLNANDIDEAGRIKAEEKLLECVDQASYIGADRLVFLAGHYDENDKEIALRQLLKTTSNVCKYAGERHITVEIEPFDYDIAKKSLLGPAELTARFSAMMRTQCSNFGLLIDLSHIPMLYDRPAHVIGALRPYITHFHIGNTVCSDPSDDGYGDEHQRFGFPNSSNDTEQLLDFLRVLRREGFFDETRRYLLSFEVKPWRDEDSLVVLANAIRVLNRAWALL